MKCHVNYANGGFFLDEEKDVDNDDNDDDDNSNRLGKKKYLIYIISTKISWNMYLIPFSILINWWNYCNSQYVVLRLIDATAL